MKTPKLAIVAASVVALTLSACGNGDSDTSSENGTAGGGSSEEVEILLPFPEGLPMAPVTVAKEQGLFADNGLNNVKISVADGSGYVSQQLVSGNINFALMGSADIAVAASKRDDVRVLFCHQANNVYRIAALADAGVSDLKGMAGKTLGITEPGGGENALVRAALADAGLTDSVQTLPIGGAGPQSLSALKGGQVQGYSSSYPDFVSLGTEGVEFVDITPDKYNKVPGTCMATTEEFLATEEGKQQAIAVTSSWIQAEQFVIDNRDEAFEIVCTAVPSACENEAAAQALFDEAIEVMKPDDDSRIGDTTPEVWETVVEILSGGGTVDAGLDLTDTVSGGTVEEVREAAFEGAGI